MVGWKVAWDIIFYGIQVKRKEILQSHLIIVTEIKQIETPFTILFSRTPILNSSLPLKAATWGKNKQKYDFAILFVWNNKLYQN